MKTFHAATPAAWRAWLARNHASETEVWLVFYKRHTGKASIEYSDALDEALCFGWVDSLIKRLDAARYARKFTPRKASSNWSAINRTRYGELNAAGRVQPPGLERAPTDRKSERPPRVPDTVPKYMLDALERHPAARANFDALAPSHRRRYVIWVDTAKQQETKLRRLNEAIRLLSAGKPLGLK
jgi:uncharacterized protein YdeI (YjbR/CyaY-like superfamily)